jgi:predicted TPR repeat methyltransferase
VRSILDVGCGLGLLRGARRSCRAHACGARVSGVRPLWLAARFRRQPQASRSHDLVICYDVLQYLGTADARLAAASLARLCRGCCISAP